MSRRPEPYDSSQYTLSEKRKKKNLISGSYATLFVMHLFSKFNRTEMS